MAALNAAAPRITDHLCEACAAHFESVKAHLAALGVPFRVEPGLVRGLDYYTRTAFEFYVAGREGQQQALGGGGRYDGLVALLGGKPTPGIGFGLGLDRVALVLAEQGGGARTPEPGPLAVVVGADPDDTVARLRVATELRAAGLRVRADLARRKLGRQLEAAGRDGAHFAVILGDELDAGQVQLRDLLAGTQRLVADRRPGTGARPRRGRPQARLTPAGRARDAAPRPTATVVARPPGVLGRQPARRGRVAPGPQPPGPLRPPDLDRRRAGARRRRLGPWPGPLLRPVEPGRHGDPHLGRQRARPADRRPVPDPVRGPHLRARLAAHQRADDRARRAAAARVRGGVVPGRVRPVAVSRRGQPGAGRRSWTSTGRIRGTARSRWSS